MADPAKPPELDPVVHGQLRLAVMSLLAVVDEGDFKWLRQKTGSTDGNLGANLAKLEEVRYIKAKKRFLGKKPNTIYKLTPEGRKAFVTYIQDLKKLLASAL
jgi:DNA-binding MarR family transcriptional regulator